MSLIIDPPTELLGKWGILAHVSDRERENILALPFGQFKPAVAKIEKELKALKKKAVQTENEHKRLRRYQA